MLSASNTLKATQLIYAMTSDPVKRGQALLRLQQLNDSAFNELFNGLNTSRFYLANIDNLGYINTWNLPTRVKIRFRYQDVLTGESGSGEKIVYNVLFEPVEQWNNVLKQFDVNLIYLRKINDKLFFKNPAVGGYNIPGYEPVVLPGGETGGSGSGSGSGSGQQTAAAGFNIESLIVPAAIGLGLYLILK